VTIVSVSRDDMVQAIVNLLKPWADPYQQQDVIAGAREQIGILEAAFPELSREGVRATRESARRILGKIANLKQKITDLQHECDGRASPEMRMRLAGIRCRPHYEVWASAERQLIATKPLDDNFVKALGDMKRECEAAIKGTLTERGGGSDQVKEWCANIACTLVIRFSKAPPTSGSADSPFRHIAGLLCKIIEPTEGDTIPDPERACEAALKRWR
jgi:hypothetical protein